MTRAGGRLRAAALAVPVALAAVALRALHLNESYEVLGDEITYLRLGQSVAEHLRVELHGRPFLLHPPGFYLLEGPWLRLAPAQGDLVHAVFVARYLNVALAGATAVALFCASRAVAGSPGGAIAAVLFAVDPFAIRNNSRLLMETATVFWVVLGLAVILPAVVDRGRLNWWRATVAAGAFGAAVVTKDEAVFITLLPLAVCALFGWGLPRRVSAAMAAGTTLVYAVYVAVLGVTGLLPQFRDEKLLGVRRLLGLAQLTGFHRAGAPSLGQAVSQQLSFFGSTYVVLALGVTITTAYLLLARGTARDRDANRFIGAFLLSVGAFSAYVLTIGTLEEYMFYLPLVLAILGISVAAPRLLERLAARRPGALRAARVLVAASMAALVAFSLVSWYRAHTTPDDGYARMTAWIASHLPRGSLVTTTNDVQEFILPRAGARTGRWVTPEQVCANRVGYVVLADRLLSDGYSYASPGFAAWVRANGVPVFSAPGSSTGHVTVYRIDTSATKTCPPRRGS